MMAVRFMDDSLILRGDGRQQWGHDEVIVS